ncbi:hypothetical protein GN956_G17017 [Arapaima gigas]
MPSPFTECCWTPGTERKLLESAPEDAPRSKGSREACLRASREASWIKPAVSEALRQCCVLPRADHTTTWPPWK